MKKGVVHLYGASRLYNYGTVCGLSFVSAPLDTIELKRVTCKNCKRTSIFKRKRTRVFKKG